MKQHTLPSLSGIKRQKGTANSRQKSTANSRQKNIANSKREEHSQQQARKAYPTAREIKRTVPTAARDARGEQCLEERSWTDDEKQEY